MGLFYPYREKAKYDKMATYATADDDDRPVEVWRSTGRHSDRKSFTPYTENPCDVLVGFADAGYLSDPHKGFYNQQQQTLLKIQVNQVKSEENVADLFTKSLPKSTFGKHVKSIGMLKLSELPWL